MRTARKLGMAAVALGAVGAALFGAGAASAQVDPQDGTHRQNSGFEACLEADSDDNVFLAEDCQPSVTTQDWYTSTVSGEPGGYDEVEQLHNLQTEQCLAATSGGLLVTEPCSSSDETQHWSGSSLLINEATGLCATAQSLDEIRMQPCDPDYQRDEQRWHWLYF